MTMTRDRLSYSRHCFQTLRDNAGCEFDWYVLDQGSADGTPGWLLAQEDLNVLTLAENIGCCRGWNLLLAEAFDPADYDAVVCFDNDCEVVQAGTLDLVARLAVEHNLILSPRVLGLRNPPPTIGTLSLDGAGGHDWTVDETTILGNIFMAIPARLLSEHGFRWDEAHEPWAGGEHITAWFREVIGGRCGYVNGSIVNHYETTDGQHDRYPSYFERRVREGGPA